MSEIQYHQHANGDVCKKDCPYIGISSPSVPVVVFDPTELPGFVAVSPEPALLIRGLANIADNEDGRPGTAKLLNWLADLVESQTTPPVVEPAGDCVVRSADGILWQPEEHPEKGHLWNPSNGNYWHSWAELLKAYGPLTILRPEATS